MSIKTEDITKEIFENAVSRSSSIKEVIVNLGYSLGNSRYDLMRYYSEKFDVPLPVYDASKQLSELRLKNRIPDEEWFVYGVLRNNTQSKRRMIAMGIPEQCSVEICVFHTEELIWNDLPVVIQVDHISGDKMDNRLNNLRLLCPLCHTQTPTYANKKRNLESGTISKHFERYGSINDAKIKEIGECKTCGTKTSHKSILRCVSCAQKSSRKIDWPSVNILLEMLGKNPFTSVAKELGVSDNAIRKHLRKHGVDPKTLSWYNKTNN